MATELTPEEDRLHRERGLLYRRLMREATADGLALSQNPAIALSGGMDSSAVLFDMVEQGSRPAVVTLQVRKDLESVDFLRARHLAKHYGLEFHPYIPTTDAELMARRAEIVVRDHPGAESRADIEVMLYFWEMMELCAREGYDYMFSGTSDPNLHQLGRQEEIFGRGGYSGKAYTNFIRVSLMKDPQAVILHHLVNQIGVGIHMPVYLAGACMPYFDVEWKLLNHPNKKGITRRAYADEIAESGLSLNPMSMQVGDSGAREYMDGIMSSSQYARDIVGSTFSSSIVYFNSLKKLHREQPRRPSTGRALPSPWLTLRKNLEDAPMPETWWDPYPTDENGRHADPPSHPDEVEDDEDLFGLDVEEDDEQADPDDVTPLLDDDGKVDTRMDCFGTPLWHPRSWNACPRALAGLCGTYRVDVPEPVYQECEHFVARADEAFSLYRECADIVEETRPGAAAVLRKWADRADNIKTRIAAGEQVDLVLSEA